MNWKKCTAFCLALLFGCSAFSFAVGAYRGYDSTTDDYPAFSTLVQSADADYEVIVKTDGMRPDFRALHPAYTVAGPDDIYVLCFNDAAAADNAVDAMQTIRGVAYAELNGVVSAQGTQSAAAYTTYGAAQMGVDDFAAELLQRNDLEPVTVAVVDSGIIATLPVFRGRLVEGTSLIYVPNEEDDLGEDIPLPYDTDDFGHGTSVASVIADCTQGLPVYIMPVKVLRNNGRGTFLDMANGIRYAAEQGVEIINLSVASTGVSCSSLLHEAIDFALEHGSLTVSASGNQAINMDKQDCCPAHLQQGIVVSACAQDDSFNTHSCFGSSIDLCAPGLDVPCTRANGSIGYADGTSFAAPHVSAVAAMLKLYMPDADIDMLTELLTTNARDLEQKGFDVYTGWGIPDLSGLDGTKRAAVSRTLTDSTSRLVPQKTKYYYKEQFDPHDFYLQKTYSDGTTETEYADFTRTGITYPDISALRPGSHTVQVSLGEVQSSFDIRITLRWWQWPIWILLFGFIWY